MPFKQLFNISAVHDFYKDRNSVNDVKFSPTPETVALLKGLRMLVRTTSPGLTVLAQVASNSSDKLLFPFGLNDKIKFVFKVEQVNPYFQNFSDLAIPKPDIPFFNPLQMAYYFTNLNTNPINLTNPAQSLKLLSVPGIPNTSEVDRVVLLPKVFKFHLPTPVLSVTIELWEKNGVVPLEVKAKTGSIASPIAFVELDWKKYPSGFYKIRKNSDPFVNIYLDNDLYGERPFGIAELFHNNNVDTTYAFAVSGGGSTVNINPQFYHIFFKSRNTIWRYQFQKDIANIIIRDQKGDFTKDVANKKFESSSPIAFSEAYRTVEMSVSGGPFMKVPNPDYRIMKPDLANNKVYTEIYL